MFIKTWHSHTNQFYHFISSLLIHFSTKLTRNWFKLILALSPIYLSDSIALNQFLQIKNLRKPFKISSKSLKMSVSLRILAQFASESSASASIVLHKRTFSKLFVESVENQSNSVENPLNILNSRLKRVRKAS